MIAAKRGKINCDLYLMASVGPKATGLPFVVYISEQQGGAGPWVGVRRESGGCSAIVSIAEPARIFQGSLEEQKLGALAAWIAYNRDVLLGYWDRSIESTADVLAALKPLPSGT